MTTALKSRNIIYKWPDKINNLIFIPKLYIFLINVSHTILYLPIKNVKYHILLLTIFIIYLSETYLKLTFKVLTDPQGHQAFIGSTKTPIPIDPTCGEHDSLSLHLSLFLPLRLQPAATSEIPVALTLSTSSFFDILSQRRCNIFADEVRESTGPHQSIRTVSHRHYEIPVSPVRRTRAWWINTSRGIPVSKSPVDPREGPSLGTLCLSLPSPPPVQRVGTAVVDTCLSLTFHCRLLIRDSPGALEKGCTREVSWNIRRWWIWTWFALTCE